MDEGGPERGLPDKAAMGRMSVVWRVGVIAGDLAVWSGAYVAGVIALMSWLDGIPVRPLMIAFGFLTAQGVYLLDRIKTTDSHFDPADLEADPRRHGWLRCHGRLVRLGSLVCIVSATIVGWTIAPVVASLPVLGAIGIVLYTTRIRTRRPKDILGLKNAYVAVGITGFSMIALLGQVDGSWAIREVWDGLLGVFGIAFLLVLGDAMLCDLDDEPSDRRHGAATVPVVLGRRATWVLAGVLHLVVAGWLVLGRWEAPLMGRMILGGLVVVVTLVLRGRAQRRIRDWVDARLAVIVGVALLFG